MSDGTGTASGQERPAGSDWWSARPAGSRLVGLVVAREGMPSVTRQREALTGFGVEIDGFRHPVPEILESWGDRVTRLLDTLKSGDVLVVANRLAIGSDRAEAHRTATELRQRGIIVKVVEQRAPGTADPDD